MPALIPVEAHPRASPRAQPAIAPAEDLLRRDGRLQPATPLIAAFDLPVGLLPWYQGIMKKQTVVPRKKRGPPATGKGEPVVVRMHPPMLTGLDGWIAKQKQPFPSRPEAVRRLVEIGLKAKAK
jgi:hypothetical protein